MKRLKRLEKKREIQRKQDKEIVEILGEDVPDDGELQIHDDSDFDLEEFEKQTRSTTKRKKRTKTIKRIKKVDVPPPLTVRETFPEVAKPITPVFFALLDAIERMEAETSKPKPDDIRVQLEFKSGKKEMAVNVEHKKRQREETSDINIQIQTKKRRQSKKTNALKKKKFSKKKKRKK